jgi:DNA polymerase-3 subunit gamma/tau
MSTTPHLSLARTYRPKDFSTLRGQEVLVRTQSNAINYNRLSDAILLTGIRGIGKTTTARIIAQTVNCTNIQIATGSIPLPCFTCQNCQEMMQAKHPDILEIDAASKTGVGDIRELIEHASYLPLLAKYKFYIIDEVHMLSTSAFNALLKILEEPPAHVKFIFATTEVRKIPITILSRCQRFDLKRLSKMGMINHLQDICSQENITIDNQSLEVIAVKSEGSVRDALSLLDQLLAYAGNNKAITLEMLQTALSLVSSEKLLQLFELIVSGNIAGTLELFKTLTLNNIAPLTIFEELLAIINLLSKLKSAPQLEELIAATEAVDLPALKNIATRVSIMSLTSLWQMLLKGMQEMTYAPNAASAAEMLLIRICYMAQLPPLAEVIAQLQTKEPVSMAQQVATSPVTSTLQNFEQLVELFCQNKELVLYHHLLEDVRLIQFEPGKLVISPDHNVPKDFCAKVASYLQEWTGSNWLVSVSKVTGGTTIGAQQNAQQQALVEQVANETEVKEVLEMFPGARIVDVKLV